MSLNAYVPSVDATSSDGSSPATILQKMQSLTSRESISARPYHPPPEGRKRRAPGRAGRPKPAVEQPGTDTSLASSRSLSCAHRQLPQEGPPQPPPQLRERRRGPQLSVAIGVATADHG